MLGYVAADKVNLVEGPFDDQRDMETARIADTPG
jgi:hypothetical protein